MSWCAGEDKEQIMDMNMEASSSLRPPLSVALVSRSPVCWGRPPLRTLVSKLQVLHEWHTSKAAHDANETMFFRKNTAFETPPLDPGDKASIRRHQSRSAAAVASRQPRAPRPPLDLPLVLFGQIMKSHIVSLCCF